MIPSYDLRKTVSFFTDVLEFKIDRDDETYFILRKDNVMVHVLRAGPDIGEMSFYLQIDDVEKVWEKLSKGPADLIAKAPFDRDYGMREVHVIVPETKTLMFIGQPINPPLGK